MASAADARALLTNAGWQLLATGDWSWVFASPDEAVVARVTPWDPAYRLHAKACLRNTGHPHLPRISAIVPILGDGYVVFIERLNACDETRAAAFCAELNIANESGYDIKPPARPAARPPSPGLNSQITPSTSSLQNQHAAIDSLRLILTDLRAKGARTLPFWGGSDVRRGNLMCDATGQIKVIDPIFVRGLAIVDAIQRGDGEQLRRISLKNLEAFLTIPVFASGAETDALRKRLHEFY